MPEPIPLERYTERCRRPEACLRCVEARRDVTQRRRPVGHWAIAFVARLACLAAVGAGSAGAESAGALAAGEYHACAVTTGGGVQCWGSNSDGQLGDGTTTHSSVPVAVSGLTNGVATVAAGFRHSCALTTGGGVQCWGYNQLGQLGNDSTTDSSVPVAVNGLASGVAAVAAGAYHACALTTGGGVQCWGLNSSGQLGGAAGTISSVPVAVSGLASGVAAIAAGGFHTCALTTGGGVQCWGFNENGQLGNDTTTDSSVPVAVTGASSDVEAIAAGAYHSCALTTGGGALCWGLNDSGQLGNDTTTDSHVPVAVTGASSDVEAIAAGAYHSCRLSASGDAGCWGSNGSGQLGNGTTTNSSIPVAVSGLASGVVVIATGGFHTCALTTGGGVRCWGSNIYGQLGNGTSNGSSIPIPVIGFQGPPPVPALGTPTLGLLAATLGLAGSWSRRRSVRLRTPGALLPGGSNAHPTVAKNAEARIGRFMNGPARSRRR